MGILISSKCRTQNLQNRQYSPFTTARTTKYNNRGKFTFILKKNINIIHNCFKYEQRNIPIQILQISNRLSGPRVVLLVDYEPQ